jgi:hypothetical protein
MASSPGKTNLNIRNFPSDLRKRLKLRALSRDLDLRDLVIRYLQLALDRDTAGIVDLKKNKDRVPSQISGRPSH